MPASKKPIRKRKAAMPAKFLATAQSMTMPPQMKRFTAANLPMGSFCKR